MFLVPNLGFEREMTCRSWDNTTMKPLMDFITTSLENAATRY